MNRILAFAVALAASTGAFAQLYKWVDKDGRVTYSDRPPPAQESKQLNIAPAPGAPQRSALERDKELEKGRADAREKSKTAEEAAKRAEIEQENCNRAKAYLKTVSEGGRIVTYDDKGERVLLDDDRIEQERAKARKLVEETCKPS